MAVAPNLMSSTVRLAVLKHYKTPCRPRYGIERSFTSAAIAERRQDPPEDTSSEGFQPDAAWAIDVNLAGRAIQAEPLPGRWR